MYSRSVVWISENFLSILNNPPSGMLELFNDFEVLGTSGCLGFELGNIVTFSRVMSSNLWTSLISKTLEAGLNFLFFFLNGGAAYIMELPGIDIVKNLLMLLCGISRSELFCFPFLSNFLPFSGDRIGFEGCNQNQKM